MDILIIRYSSLGDLLISTPVIKAIRENYTNDNLDILVDERYKAVFENNPHLNEIITFDRKDSRFKEALRLKKVMKKYDVVFDLQNKPFSKIMSKLLSRGDIFTFNKAGCSDFKSHILELYRSYLLKNGIVMKDRNYVLNYKREAKTVSAGINIEGGHLSKRLSKEQIIEIARRLGDKGFTVYLIGTELSRDLARDVMALCKNIVDTTSYSVKEVIVLISSLSILITPDSGPMHIAAALNVPAVAIFGSTSPYRWLPPSRYISPIYSEYKCSPCSEYGTSICRAMKSFSCINEISPDIITLEAERLYERKD